MSQKTAARQQFMSQETVASSSLWVKKQSPAAVCESRNSRQQQFLSQETVVSQLFLSQETVASQQFWVKKQSPASSLWVKKQSPARWLWVKKQSPGDCESRNSRLASCLWVKKQSLTQLFVSQETVASQVIVSQGTVASHVIVSQETVPCSQQFVNILATENKYLYECYYVGVFAIIINDFCFLKDCYIIIYLLLIPLMLFIYEIYACLQSLRLAINDSNIYGGVMWL